MTVAHESYRRILSATIVMGGATIASILIGVVRTKIFALIIGPAGIGLIGLLTSIMATAAAVGSMGLGFSGVREIAANEERRGLVRKALWLAIWPLAIITAAALWLGRFDISRWVTGSEDQALGVGLTGIAAALAIVAVAQTAEIQGLGRVGDVARIRVGGALLALFLGVPAVVYAGPIGIVLAIIAIPVGNVLAAVPYRPRSELPPKGGVSGNVVDEWRRLLTLGATIMVTTSLATGALVVIRTLVIRQDGLEAAGLYQAAYAISALNASLVLSAMATDYFPRLSGVEADRSASSTLVNQQLHAALLLASPVLLGMAAVAPLVLNLLYSSAFTPAADLLRWQLTGELFKLPGWALGFLLVARADKTRFLLVETTFVVAYIAATYLLLPPLGLAGAGIGYALAYLLYSLLLVAICSRLHDATLTRENLVHLLAVGAALVAVALFGHVSPWVAAGIGLLAAAGAAVHAWRHLSEIRRVRSSRGAVSPPDGLQPE